MLHGGKLGDGDAVGLASLLDSTSNQYHLTTINLAEGQRSIDVPREHAPLHADRHFLISSDKLSIDPGGPTSPVIWDNFSDINDPATAPSGWYPTPTVGDVFDRAVISGRTSVLRFNHGAAIREQYLTNVHPSATAGTFSFGAPAHPEPTEMCMEVIARNSNSAGMAACNHYFGFVGDSHSVGTAAPQTGIYLQWDGMSGALTLNTNNTGGGAPETISVGTLLGNIFYRLKLCFSYRSSLTQSYELRARAWIDDSDEVELLVLSNNDSNPTGSGNIYLGTATTDAIAYSLEMDWVSVIYRGIGSEFVLGL